MSTSGGRGGTAAAIPAWKLRMMQQQQQPPRGGGSMPSGNPTTSSSSSSSMDQVIPKNSTTSSCSSTNPADARAKLKKKMEAATLDPNLPPAFKVAMKGRLAFARQQERRKNNDTWVSLNSSHINAASTRPVNIVDGEDDDDDSSLASMGEDSYYEQESHDDDEAIVEEEEEDEDD